MQRIDPVKVLASLALFALALAIGGCGNPDEPYTTITERPDTATVDMGDPVDAKPHCEISDSFDVALLPGDECSPFTVPCSVPVKCPFPVAVARSKCINGACCQLITGQNDVMYRDCGDGIAAFPDY